MSRKKLRSADAPEITVVATKKPLFNRKRLLAVLMLVALGALGYWLYALHAKRVEQQGAGDKHQSVLRGVAQSQAQRNYGQEAKQLQAYLDTKPPEQYASQDVIRLASAYINDGQYDKAIATLESAKNTYPDSKYAAIRGLGFAYMVRGDKLHSQADYQKALDYFKQAVAIESANPDTAHVAGSDQTNIRYLQEKLQ